MTELGQETQIGDFVEISNLTNYLGTFEIVGIDLRDDTVIISLTLDKSSQPNRR